MLKWRCLQVLVPLPDGRVGRGRVRQSQAVVDRLGDGYRQPAGRADAGQPGLHDARPYDAADPDAAEGMVAQHIPHGKPNAQFRPRKKTFGSGRELSVGAQRQPSRLSKRDLIRDLGLALKKHGIRLIVYLPSQG